MAMMIGCDDDMGGGGDCDSAKEDRRAVIPHSDHGAVLPEGVSELHDCAVQPLDRNGMGRSLEGLGFQKRKQLLFGKKWDPFHRT